MIKKFILLPILWGAFGAAQEITQVIGPDGLVFITDGTLYMTNRRYKQTEAFDVCEDREDLELIEILSSDKTNQVMRFLVTQEVRTAWTAGMAGTDPYNEYFWGFGEQPMNYSNWENEPSKATVSQEDWYESGIVIVTNPPGKWLLKHREE